MGDAVYWDWQTRERVEQAERDLWDRLWRKHGEDEVTDHFDVARRRLHEQTNRSLLDRRFGESGAAITSLDREAMRANTLKPTPSLSAVKTWVASNNNGRTDPRMLVLLGSVGVGKTVAAAWALWEFGGTYVVADELRKRMSPPPRRFDDDSPHPSPVEGTVVVLDDVGTETDARFQSAFFELVNSRMRDGCLTIITGNVTKQQMKERYDARIIDRLNHCGRVVEISGKSLRKGGGGF